MLLQASLWTRFCSQKVKQNPAARGHVHETHNALWPRDNVVAEPHTGHTKQEPTLLVSWTSTTQPRLRETQNEAPSQIPTCVSSSSFPLRLVVYVTSVENLRGIALSMILISLLGGCPLADFPSRVARNNCVHQRRNMVITSESKCMRPYTHGHAHQKSQLKCKRQKVYTNGVSKCSGEWCS